MKKVGLERRSGVGGDGNQEGGWDLEGVRLR
jgi:hypothetical protein